MKRFRSLLFVLVAISMLVVSVAAQTSLSTWPYYVEVTPRQSNPGLYSLTVPRPVMDKAQSNLADLRLFDSTNREIPYGILVRREGNEMRETPAGLIVFELKETQTQPLRLFFGNTTLAAPHYDFEKEFPARLAEEPLTPSEVGEVQANREYKPEPKPLTERVPWLIYLVLAASSIALGVILFNLARTATRLNEPNADNANQ